MFWKLLAWATLAINVVLQGLDVWTTVVVLEAGGTEQNMWSRFVMERFGVSAWVALKGILMAAIIAVAWRIRNAEPGEIKRTAFASTLVMIWMAGVIANNLAVMARI